MEKVKCPKCGASDYTVELSCTTGLYYQPHIVDGVNINPDGNYTTENCKCCKCGSKFAVVWRYGKIEKVGLVKPLEKTIQSGEACFSKQKKGN